MTNPYSGSNFDDFLAEEGILEEVSARALKRLLAMQVAEVMEATKISKSQLAACRRGIVRRLACTETAIFYEKRYW